MISPNFFSNGSPYLNHPLLTTERTAIEIDYVLTQGGLKLGARVLDLGCGPGRHSLELARRGYRVVGIDPSLAMIAAAIKNAAHSDLDPVPEFIRSNAEDFVTDQPFDGVICLFTTLGQMDQTGDNEGLVNNVLNALIPGGIFIVEVPNRDWVVPNLKAHDSFGDDKNYTEIKRSFDPQSNALTEAFTLVSNEGRSNYLLRYRLYNQVELGDLLGDAGFEPISFHGDYEANSFAIDSRIILAVVRRP